MSSTAPPLVPAGHLTGGHDTSRRPTAIVAALALTQTIGSGTVSYAFAVLLTRSPPSCTPPRPRSPGAYTASFAGLHRALSVVLIVVTVSCALAAAAIRLVRAPGRERMSPRRAAPNG